MSTYYVTRIEEPDFGCEGRPEGQEIKDKVYLKEEITKEETIIFMEDKLLYERDINEGMKVVIDGDEINLFCIRCFCITWNHRTSNVRCNTEIKISILRCHHRFSRR